MSSLGTLIPNPSGLFNTTVKRSNLALSIALPLSLYLLGRTLHTATTSRNPIRILRSPRQTQQQTNPSELPYPPDALTGARDISTPHGSLRAYEWGPREGRKVLFIHGISTPCIAFASLASLLVERGCRVLLFDLAGRGYSDAPDPEIVRQDLGFWCAQIFAVLASSEMSWMGNGERFSIVGYSMGGGIGAGFTSFFPEMVESLILVAPGGLLRRTRIAASSKLLYSGLLPDRLVEVFVRRRLQNNTPPPPASSSDEHDKNSPPDAAVSELPAHPALTPDSTAPIFPERPGLRVADAVDWQLRSHPGFLPSFISSIRHAPVSDEHERWSAIGSRCEARRRGELPGLDEGKVLILLGSSDSVIVADEIEEDATAALGKDNVLVRRLEGGHDVPIVNARGCCEEIVKFWAGEVGAMV